MSEVVIGIRTNSWTLMEERLYTKLLQYFSAKDIFVIVDETDSKVSIPKYLNKISWDKEFISNKCLLDYNHFNKGIGWLCGDYFYYAFRENVESEYYWLIEPDVLFSFDNIADFFSPFESMSEDGLFAKTRRLPESDYWYKSAMLINDKEQMGCSFPLSRLSGNAIDLCKKERQKISTLYKLNGSFSYDDNSLGVHFPNDEVLVLNTLIREGLKIGDFSDIFPASFNFFGYHSWFSIPQQDTLLLENKVIHPARDINRIKNNVVENIIRRIDECLELHFITVDNISLLSSQIASDIEQYCKNYLLSKSKRISIFERSKIFFKDDFIQRFKLEKQWIYNNRTIVFEFFFNNMNIVFDVYLDGDDICCDIFDRNNSSSKWIYELSLFLELDMNNGKVNLFRESSLNNIDEKFKKMILSLSKYIYPNI